MSSETQTSVCETFSKNPAGKLPAMERLLQLLQSIHPLSVELQEYLGTVLKRRVLSKKQFLLEAGHICRDINFVDTGLLRCFYPQKDNETSSWFMREGDVIVSIESFSHQRESYEWIQALEDTVLCDISYAELQHIYRTFSEFNFVGRAVLENYYQFWAQQLYALRMKTGSERYAWLLEHHFELTQRVPANILPVG